MKNSYTSRRSFLGTCASALLGASLLFPTYSRAEEQKPTLATIVQEDLPQEIRAMNFNLMDYRRGEDPSKEVILLGEHHLYEGIREKELKLLEFLIKKYQPDSLGLEGFWEEIIPNASKDYPSELYGKDLSSKIKSLGSSLNSSAIKRLNQIGIILPNQISIGDVLKKVYVRLNPLVEKNKIPLYGIEDRNLLLRMALETNFRDLMQYLIKEYPNKKFEEIENIEEINRFYNIIREYFPNLGGIPKGQSLKEYFEEYNKEQDKKGMELGIRCWDLEIRDRNKAFARNIEKSMKKLTSQRGMAIMGFGHVDLYPFTESTQTHKLIPYTTLVISTPGIRVEEKERERKELLKKFHKK
jgi:hypothetical protein